MYRTYITLKKTIKGSNSLQWLYLWNRSVCHHAAWGVVHLDFVAITDGRLSFHEQQRHTADAGLFLVKSYLILGAVWHERRGRSLLRGEKTPRQVSCLHLMLILLLLLFFINCTSPGTPFSIQFKWETHVCNIISENMILFCPYALSLSVLMYSFVRLSVW